MRLIWIGVVALALVLAGCGGSGETVEETAAGGMADHIREVTGTVDQARIANADSEPENWLATGRTFSEQRFSPLDQINDSNVGELGLSWTYDTGERRGHQATPIVVDGVMYITGSWSKVYALDARTGEQIWAYDPQVPGAYARWACCDVVNRGVALHQGKVYVGTIDGRLISLDAASGEEVWSVQTTDPEKRYTITGAPRIGNGKVVIGNGGAEYGVRGYVTAYDAETGDQAWRFFTVPGNPADPFEHPEMEEAAKTWTGEWWKVGGGGTAWDSMAYDPELELIYIGVGNGAPWSRAHRSPDGGDNLYLSSVIALDINTGSLAWHYQTTPEDNWDFTAVQPITLAELEIEGETRKVLMQAPKNGFFYVLDRATGELLSAEKYVVTTWASHVDMETGRPVEVTGGDYDGEDKVVLPGPFGGHNWHPQSFSPDTGLVYIPARDASFIYPLEEEFDYDRRTLNLGLDLGRFSRKAVEMEQPVPVGYLRAWDPVESKVVWDVEQPGVWNGGVLSTAGNLVVQGSSEGSFAVFAADSGAELWSSQLNVGIVAAPVTYAIDGKQYIAVLGGWGGAVSFGIDLAISAAYSFENVGRLFVFELGGTAPIPAVRERDLTIPEQPPLTASADELEMGQDLFHEHCSLCHGVLAHSAGIIADLRFMDTEAHALFNDVVLEGSMETLGMARFDDLLSEEESALIQSYVVSRAIADRELQATTD
jgi:PQQ-dependent dehydrogenase (methanol/ethanol family)